MGARAGGNVCSLLGRAHIGPSAHIIFMHIQTTFSHSGGDDARSVVGANTNRPRSKSPGSAATARHRAAQAAASERQIEVEAERRRLVRYAGAVLLTSVKME